MYSYAFLILLLPFLSFLLLGLLGMKMPKKLAGYIGTALMLVVVCLCYYTAYQYFFRPLPDGDGLQPYVARLRHISTFSAWAARLPASTRR